MTETGEIETYDLSMNREAYNCPDECVISQGKGGSGICMRKEPYPSTSNIYASYDKLLLNSGFTCKTLDFWQN